MGQEGAGPAGVLGGDHGNRAQHDRRARREVVQVAEGSGDDVEGAGSGQGSLGGER
jgi:hypothetical protein